MDVIVVGNVALDIICYPVNDVPRYDSLGFERALVAPGGCGSNVAIGLAALGVNVALVAVCGHDDSSQLMLTTWKKWGIDLEYIKRLAVPSAAVSVGLLDSQLQPRFIHATGANYLLTPGDLDIVKYAAEGAKILIVAGYFVLPGLLTPKLAEVLCEAQEAGLMTILDVVHSPKMSSPGVLWPVLPYLDIFLCNLQEAELMTGEGDPAAASRILRSYGAKTVIIKLGNLGCWIANAEGDRTISGVFVENVVDTTGAGDGFAAGMLKGLVQGNSIDEACVLGNQAGAKMVSAFGSITGWGEPHVSKIS